MNDLSRILNVYADGKQITGFRRARLTGRDSLGLYPMPFCLKIWNLADEDFNRLAVAKGISVIHGDSVLASGTVSDVYRQTTSDGTLAEIVFSAGMDLWEAPVSLSVEAGKKVSETIRTILEASGTGIPLLGFEGPDPVRTRGQSFCGSAAYAVETALSATSSRCCLVPAGLCIVPAEGVEKTMDLNESDLIDAPSRPSGNLMVLRTRVVGWLLGKKVSVKWKGEQAEGLVIERSVDADNMEGNWQSELLLELEI